MAIDIESPSLSPPSPPPTPRPLISLMVSVDVKHHVYYLPGVHVPGESGTNGIVKGVQGAKKGNDRTSSLCSRGTHEGFVKGWKEGD